MRYFFYLLVSLSLVLEQVNAQTVQPEETPSAAVNSSISEDSALSGIQNDQDFEVSEPDESALESESDTAREPLKEEEKTVPLPAKTDIAPQEGLTAKEEKEENLEELIQTLEEPKEEGAKRAEAIPADTAILQGLNKITARTSTLKAQVGSSTRFGTLEILVKQCWKSAADQTPDSKALLEIWEQPPGEMKIRKFYGWMFASSPALSALEHAVYDVTVLECAASVTPAKATAPQEEEKVEKEEAKQDKKEAQTKAPKAVEEKKPAPSPKEKPKKKDNVSKVPAAAPQDD